MARADISDRRPDTYLPSMPTNTGMINWVPFQTSTAPGTRLHAETWRDETTDMSQSSVYVLQMFVAGTQSVFCSLLPMPLLILCMRRFADLTYFRVACHHEALLSAMSR